MILFSNIKFSNLPLIYTTILISSFYSCSNSKPTHETASSKSKPKRFFNDTSFWNQPLVEGVKIDSNSGKWISMLAQDPSNENFGITYEDWTVPIFEATAHTPKVAVLPRPLTAAQLSKYGFAPGWFAPGTKFQHGSGFGMDIPIPENAKPDFNIDAHLAIVDWSSNTVWDMWGAYKDTATGIWYSNTGMKYPLDGPGDFVSFHLGMKDNETVHSYGPSRPSGVPIIAGIIRFDEVMDGEINHKLSCAIRYAALKEFTYPAIWTDGYTPGGIPEGAVIQLDPLLDINQFDLLDGEKVVARALQKYGIVVVDEAQGSPIYAEGLLGQSGKSWKGILREWRGGINSIPLKHYRVVKVNSVVRQGDKTRNEFIER